MQPTTAVHVAATMARRQTNNTTTTTTTAPVHHWRLLAQCPTGTCRGCKNLLKNCHHGIRQCTRCERKYCQVKIRGQVLVCSQMRSTATAASPMQCHCDLVKTDSCVCQACRKRYKRLKAKQGLSTTTFRRRFKRRLVVEEEDDDEEKGGNYSTSSTASTTSTSTTATATATAASAWQATTFGNHQLEEWRHEDQRRVRRRRQTATTTTAAAEQLQPSSMALPISVGFASVSAAQALQAAATTTAITTGTATTTPVAMRVRAFLGSDKSSGKVVAVPRHCSSWMEFKALLCTAFALEVPASTLRVFTDDNAFEFASLASIRDGDCLCLDAAGATAAVAGGAPLAVNGGASAAGFGMVTAQARSVVLPTTLQLEVDTTTSAHPALLFSEEEDEEWMRELAEALKDEAAALDVFDEAIRDRPPRAAWEGTRVLLLFCFVTPSNNSCNNNT